MEKYELRYLPLFYDDLSDAVNYIMENLHNPQAAENLVDAVEKAILLRQNNAESFEPYLSKCDREHTYYSIYVNNYVVYYVVLEHRIMEVRRFLYKGRNREEII